MRTSLRVILLILIVVSLTAAFSTPATATLIDRGNGLIFDNVLNITWLQNANYAATELTATRVTAIIAEVGSVAGHALTTDDFFPNGTGKMTWWRAMAWAQALNFGGFDDWRLPSTDVNGDGTVVNCLTNTDCPDNEYGHMFYQNLKETLGLSKTGDQVGDGGVTLNNIQSYYWSGTVFMADPADFWGCYFESGGQCFSTSRWADRVAWAVRDGDVAAVPEPGTLCLLASGLAGLGGVAWRRSRLPGQHRAAER